MAGFGSDPAEDKANHPNRKVDRTTVPTQDWSISSELGLASRRSGGRAYEPISTQPKPLGKPDKYRPESLMVQRVRRARQTGTQHPQRGYD